jgi:hypothetical protein
MHLHDTNSYSQWRQLVTAEPYPWMQHRRIQLHAHILQLPIPRKLALKHRYHTNLHFSISWPPARLVSTRMHKHVMYAYSQRMHLHVMSVYIQLKFWTT